MIPSTTQSEVEALGCCPLCRSDERRFIMGSWSDPMGVARCSACDLVYATGRLHTEALDTDYYGVRASAPSAFDHARKRKAIALYDRLVGGRLRSPNPGASALDIGCNIGALLDVLSDWGYRTEGVERSPAAAAVARRHHDVHNVDVLDPGLCLGRQFTLITMTHVLEHLERPAAVLGFLRRHLEPGGVAVVEVPNWSDLARPLWGRRYRPLELGDHVAFYESTTLRRAVEGTGLEVLRLWSGLQGSTLVMPSLLSALDLGRQWLRPHARAGRVDARPNRSGGSSSLRLRILEALDRFDPWLERVGQGRGANLVAIVANSRAGVQ